MYRSCLSTIVVAAIAAAAFARADGERLRTVMRWDDRPADRIVIDKSDRRLRLFMRDGRIKQFPVSLGANPVGHKVREGDSRTPEGNYVIDMKNADSDYYLSLRISYPNARDVAAARRLGVSPGGQIMIHGYPNDASEPYADFVGKDWTDGCIAVTNAAMMELWLAVREKTPVTIRP